MSESAQRNRGGSAPSGGLEDAHEIFQSILANISDAVIVSDPDGKFLVFNPATERMFGKGATHVPKREWSHQYGLYLPDRFTLYPHEQLPLTRVWMKGVTGLEILARMCAISPRPRIIVITARDDLAARATAMQNGPVAFFIKPFDDEQFLGAVHDALGQARKAKR